MKKIILIVAFNAIVALIFGQSRSLYPIKWMIKNEIYYIGDVKLKAGIDTVLFIRMLHFAESDEALTKKEVMALARDSTKPVLSGSGNYFSEDDPNIYIDFLPEFTNVGLEIINERGWRIRRMEIFEDFLDLVYWK